MSTVLTGTLLTGTVHGDATLTMTQIGGPERSAVYVANSKVRLQSLQPAERGRYMIFDAERNVLAVVDESRQQYHELTTADVQRQAARQSQQREQSLAQLRQRMRDMPPEQRQLLERQMQRMGVTQTASASASALRIVPTKQRRVVGSVECVVNLGYRGDRLSHEICVASHAVIGLPAGDAHTLAAMFRFMTEMSALSQSAAGSTHAVFDLDGLPVLIIDHSRSTEQRLTDIQTTPADPRLFEVPAGYTRQPGFPDAPTR